ncbi:MAG: helix-turn-helix transcriptional regulator [Clostridium sp.]
MAISYNKLWKLLIDKQMSKVDLRDSIGMGPGTLAKLSKNQRVSLEVLERICKELDCNFVDVIDYIED